MTKGSSRLIRPSVMAWSTARSGSSKAWVGRLWQSTQSMVRGSARASSSGDHLDVGGDELDLLAVVVALGDPRDHLPPVVGGHVADALHVGEVAAVDALPPLPVSPPILRTRTVVEGVFDSSAAYLVRTTNLSPWNFWGQWHVSQVSRAGRSWCTGLGIGRE